MIAGTRVAPANEVTAPRFGEQLPLPCVGSLHLLCRDSVLFDVGVDPRVPIRAGSARLDVVERFGVFHPVLPAQLPAVRHDELPDVVPIGGDVVVAQQGQPLMALIPLENVWITANFKETQLTYMRPGQRATVKVDAYGGQEFKGHVDSIAPATGARFSLLPPENATGNYVKVVQRVPVKIVLEAGQDPEHLLRPGMSVVPTVYTK